MSTVHNLLIRGLNSIYLQAPHIKPADEKHFCEYMKIWCLSVLTHHHEEEELFFPWVEKLTSVKGLMDKNLEQHHAFHVGLDVFDEYVKGVLAGKQKYDGAKVVELIDGFGAVLAQHLSDEIPTLLALKQYADVLTGANSLPKKFDEMGKQAMVSSSDISFWLLGLLTILKMQGIGYDGSTFCRVLQRRCRMRGWSVGTMAAGSGDSQAHYPLGRLST